MSTTALQPKKDAQIEQQASEHCYTPRVDIRETTEAIHVQAEMPGVDNKHVDVRLEEDTLTILGRVTGDDNGKPVYSEYRTGNFERAFRISEAINAKGIQATMANGILSLTLPKAESAKPRQIKVNAA